MNTPWVKLLSQRFTNVQEEYGPNSQAVASALMVLVRTQWLQNVGESWLEYSAVTLGSVTLVRSWGEATTMFGNYSRYNVNGIFEGPCSRIGDVFARFPEREDWWQRAREDAKQYTALGGWIPASLPQEQQDLMYEHLYEYVSMLLAEILASPEAECTYFREQLTWFHAGHFPCGWDGDWPNGRMRVF
ncbi:MAG TPA: hypothetical protein VHT91_16900 [Kofleriaceae bacterium]|jgi:hypothetical protein|nr:hypothetical protein [Kofleriaceae bacterium]